MLLCVFACNQEKDTQLKPPPSFVLHLSGLFWMGKSLMWPMGTKHTFPPLTIFYCIVYKHLIKTVKLTTTGTILMLLKLKKGFAFIASWHIMNT